jgi:hypothetical protein
MPQGKQVGAFPLGQGLSQENGEFVAPAGKLAIATNAVIDKVGTVGIRPGFSKRLETEMAGGTFHPTFREWEIGGQTIGSDGYRAAVWLASMGKWQDFDHVPEANITRRRVASRGIDVIPHDAESIFCNGIYLYAWTDNLGTIWIDAIDSLTGAKFTPGTTFSYHGGRIRLLALGTRVFIVYRSGATTLSIRSIDTTTMAAISAASAVTAIFYDRGPVFEATTDGALSTNHIFVVCNVQATPPGGAVNGEIYRLDYNKAVIHHQAVGGYAYSNWGLSAVAGKDVYYAWDDSGASALRCGSVVALDLSASVAENTIATPIGTIGGGTVIRRLACRETSDGMLNYVVWETIQDGTLPSYQAVYVAEFEASSVVSQLGVTYGLALSSLPFLHGGTLYAVLMLPAQSWQTVHLQPNSYLCELNFSRSGMEPARVVTRIAQQRCGDLLFKMPSTVSLVTASTISVAVPKLSDTQINTQSWLQDEGFDIYDIQFKANTCGLPVHIGPFLVLSGGVPVIYDGKRMFECGFHFYPFGPSGDKQEVGGLEPLGTYHWKAVYRWVDSQGQEHQSSPSEPIGTELTEGYLGAVIRIACLTLTEMEDAEDRTHLVSIDLYRTKNGGSTYYMVYSLPNDRHNHTVVFTDIYSDAQISDHRILYTDGGVLPNEQCPASRHLTVHNNRLFSIVADYPESIWFAKQMLPGEGPAFCRAFLVSNVQCTEYVAVADASSNLLAGRSDGWDVVYGQGPGDNGLGSTYEEPVQIVADVGCVDARSLVPIPGGYLFQSAGGIYSINYAGQTEWTGASVRDSLAAYSEIVWGCLDSQNRRALMIAHNPELHKSNILVYYYTIGQWCQWSVPSSGGAANASFVSVLKSGRLLHLCEESGHVLEENPVSSQDADLSWPALTLRWNWISPHGLQGYGSTWKAVILGRYLGAHSADITLYHDYSTTLVSTHSFSEAETLALVSGVREQLEAACKNTQGQAIQIGLTLTQGATPTSGRLMSVEGLAIEYGVEPGLMRVPQSARK